VDEAKAPNPVTVRFRVDDLEKTLARLVEMGAKVRKEPTDILCRDRIASVEDPDGNLMAGAAEVGRRRSRSSS